MKKLMLVTLLAAFAAAPAYANHDMWKEKDANGDGFVTKAEATAYHDKKFDMMDTNHDGKLSKDEAKAHWKHKGWMHKDKMMHQDGKTPNGTDDGDNGKDGHKE